MQLMQKMFLFGRYVPIYFFYQIIILLQQHPFTNYKQVKQYNSQDKTTDFIRTKKCLNIL